MNPDFRFARRFLILGLLVSAIPLNGCALRSSQETSPDSAPVVIGPDEGEVFWFDPSSAEDRGKGSLIQIKMDHVIVPHSPLTLMTQELAEAGIPVHRHTFEDEILYVLSGYGSVLVGADQDKIAIEPGSAIYIPKRNWHGVINADPGERVEVLIVTTPSKEGGLADFFRKASVKPGHPPLNLPPEEFLALFDQYGMQVPEP